MLPDIVGLFMRLCTTPIIRSYGIQLIQAVLQRQMKYIYRGISSMRIPHCQSTYRLLTSMVSFNESTARDLFTTFNFQAEVSSFGIWFTELVNADMYWNV